MINGFSNCAGSIVAKYAPPTEATSTKGNNFATIFKSTLPDLTNLIVLVNVPIELANLFVPNATAGGSPIANSAGVEIKPPPPTTESINAAKKPNKTMINITYTSHPMT